MKRFITVALIICASCRAFEPTYKVGDITNYPSTPKNKDYADFHNHMTMKPYYHLIKNPHDLVSTTFVNFDPASPARPLGYTPLPTSVWDPTGKLSYAAWTLNTKQEREYRAYGKFADLKRYRQSNWQQFEKYKLVCTSIYAFEKGLTTNQKKWWSPISGKFLKRSAFSAITGLSKERRKVVYNLGIEPFAELQAEYEFLKHQINSNRDNPPHKVVLAKPSTYDSLINLPNHTVVLISIEGGHVLLGPDVLKNNRLLLTETKESDVQDIKNRVRAIKSWEHPVFFLTLDHLIWNKLAGQAKGTDADGAKRFFLSVFSRFESFRKNLFTQSNSGTSGLHPASRDDGPNRRAPYDNGTTHSTEEDIHGLGLLAINELLSKENGKRILIDLRHSGIRTRIEYYNLIDSLYQDVPPLVSHCAASGKSLRLAMRTGLRPVYDRYSEFNNPEKFYNKIFRKGHTQLPTANQYPFKKYLTDNSINLKTSDLPDRIKVMGWFHPSSNNLSDEEIVYISNKKGLMCLSTEQRGAGGSMFKYKMNKEYYSKRLNDWLSQNRPTLSRDKADYINKYFFATAPYMRNIWYFSTFADRTDIWHAMGFSSDADGLPDPIDYVATTNKVDGFENFINDHYKAFEYVYDVKFNLDGRSMEENLRLLFSQNEKEFGKHFTRA